MKSSQPSDGVKWDCPNFLDGDSSQTFMDELGQGVQGGGGGTEP